MPLADSKKAQTIRNLWYLRVAKLVEEADEAVASIRSCIVDENLLAQFSQAERDAMLAVETNLQSLAALVGVTGAEAKYVPTHSNSAVLIGGVNDG